MNRYQSYKPSGIDWIGEIPEEWVTKRLTYSFKIQKGKIPNELIDEQQLNSLPYLSMDVLRGNEPNEFSNDKNIVEVNKGDIGILWDGSNSGEIIKINRNGILSSTVSLLSIIDRGLNKEFSYYLLKVYEKDFKSNTTGMGIPHVNGNYVRETKLIIPHISEQHQIVQFLDEKTDLIDKLISTKERKITLLKEQRTSIINQTVTRGINPNVKMKDSGVEWIGEIPEHWMISKFKFDSSTKVQYGLNISGDKYKEEGIRFIRITDLTEWGELIKEDGKYLEENDVPGEFLLNKWDVLFCRSGHTVGKSYLHKEDGKFTSGGYLVRFNFMNYFESKFIFYIGKTSFYWDWIKLNSVVSTIENVNGDKYQNFQYPKPSVQEQQIIVEFLDKRTGEIDEMVSMEQKKIDLLKEYRQSLISEVVTGKIKVTTD